MNKKVQKTVVLIMFLVMILSLIFSVAIYFFN